MMHHHRIRLVPRQRGEEGETLIELMATVVLMGVSIVALLGSLIGVMTTSNVHRRATRAGNEAVNVVESLRSVPYVPCATAGSYASAVPPAPNGFTFEITSLQRLQSATAATPVWVAPGGCAVATDTGAQQITVRVTSLTPTRVTRSLSFVKRQKLCPGSPPTSPQVC